MPRKPNAKLEDRLSEVRGRVEIELHQIEERRTALRNLLGTLQYVSDGYEQATPGRKRKMPAATRRKIAKAQKARWGERKSGKGYNRAANATNPHWSEKDDALIVQAAKAQGPVEAPKLAKGLHSKLAGRSEGAIRQRIAKLAHKGMLRQHANSHAPGVPRMVVEAA